MTHRRTRILTGALALLAVGVMLAACGDDDDATSTPTSGPAAAASPTTAATAPADASPSPGPLITIDVPAEAATVDSPFTLSGEANVFEAALTVDVLDAATGASLCARNIMATSGSGTPGAWETTLAVPPPDSPLGVTVRAYSFSADDGAIENLVERDITLSAERPSIFITSPACGVTAAPGATLSVTGRAAVFEAALTVELRDASGTAVVTQNVMAASGVEESDFTASLMLPATLTAGLYDLVAFNFSAMDGAVENEYSVQVVVQP